MGAHPVADSLDRQHHLGQQAGRPRVETWKKQGWNERRSEYRPALNHFSIHPGLPPHPPPNPSAMQQHSTVLPQSLPVSSSLTLFPLIYVWTDNLPCTGSVGCRSNPSRWRRWGQINKTVSPSLSLKGLIYTPILNRLFTIARTSKRAPVKPSPGSPDRLVESFKHTFLLNFLKVPLL